MPSGDILKYMGIIIALVIVFIIAIPFIAGLLSTEDDEELRKYEETDEELEDYDYLDDITGKDDKWWI